MTRLVRPLEHWGRHSKASLVPVILAALLGALSFLPQPLWNPVQRLPARWRFDDSSLDLRLDLRAERSHRSVISTSLLVQSDGIIMVASRQRKEMKSYVSRFDGIAATVLEHTQLSDILIGRVPLDGAAWGAWPSTGQDPLQGARLQPWSGLATAVPCIEETWISENRTLIRRIFIGPENAKVVSQNGSLAVIFHSLKRFASRCQLELLVAPLEAAEPAKRVTASELDGLADEVNDGVPFVSADTLHLTESPLPQAVWAVDASGQIEKLRSTSFLPLQRMLEENPSLSIRGSAQAVLVNDTEATPNFPWPHFLALLQLQDSSGRVKHRAYRFMAEPPFAIFQLSAELPLSEAPSLAEGTMPFALASGLALWNRTVVISYVAGDQDTRALVLTLDRMDEMFDCLT